MRAIDTSPSRRRRGWAQSRSGRKLLRLALRLQRLIGVDGRRGSDRRFLRFLLFLRFVLLLVSPLLFLEPSAEYQGDTRRWAILGALAAWTACAAVVYYRRGGRGVPMSFYVLDVLVVFTGFALALRPVVGGGGYSSVTSLQGTFFLLTYGPILTFAAVATFDVVFACAVLSAAAYCVSLLSAGISPGVLLEARNLPQLVFAVAIYFLIGLIIGLYARLLRRLFVITERLITANLLRRARERGQVIGRRQVEEEMHDRVLTPLRTVQRYLSSVADELPQEQRDRVAAGATLLDQVLRRERLRQSQEGDNLLDVVTSTYWSQRVFDPSHRMADIQISPAWIEEAPEVLPKLTEAQASDLAEILFEAIENAQKHSRGAIEVSITAQLNHDETLYCIAVTDGGSRQPSARDGSGLGLKNIARRAEAHAWPVAFHLGEAEDGSRLTITMTGPPLARQHWLTSLAAPK